jgi:hypothetical protein
MRTLCNTRLFQTTAVFGIAALANVTGCGDDSTSTGVTEPDGSSVDAGSSDASTLDSGRLDSGPVGTSDGGTAPGLDATEADSGSGDAGSAADSTTASDAAGVEDAAPDAASSDGAMVDSAVADAHAEAAATDSGGPEASTVDSGDAGACGADFTACHENGASGLCKAGLCSTCVDPTDDAHCTAAYGSTAAPFLCVAGACIAGDCRVDTDCKTSASGPLCGVATPHECGKCTVDSECAGSAPDAGTRVCDTTTGTCVTGACSSEADAGPAAGPSICPVNASDICCAAACVPGGSNACCPGQDAYCENKLNDLSATCLGGVCTVCAPVSPESPNYFVDPIHGDDSKGTGNDSASAGCAFKTITRALAVIEQSVVSATVTVIGPSVVDVGGGEVFPIFLPANVMLTTKTGTVTVAVPAGRRGFGLDAANSAIVGGPSGDGGSAPGLIIQGSTLPPGGGTAAEGIVAAGAGLTATTAPRISNLVIETFHDDGILVEGGGILNIGPGVTSTLNGTPVARASGLFVEGGQAIIDVGPTESPTHFDSNTEDGILVEGGGSVTVTGAVSNAAAGIGSVTANLNYLAGAWIEQTVANPPENAITGLVAFGSTNGYGLRFFAGSNVKLRSSVALANQLSGVIVSRSATLATDDISTIDLGAVTDAGVSFGGNTFQGTLASAKNGGAGLCLATRANAGILHAEGNTFEGVNCATTAAALPLNAAGCDNGACTGGVCDLGITAAGNTIDVATCTP